MLAVVFVLSLVAGLWFGGDTGRKLSLWAVASLAACVMAGDLLGPPDRRQARLIAALAVALVFAGGWYLATMELERSFEECVERGEHVRQALEEYRRDHGSYPASLDEMPGVEIPGGRLLRPGLMRYTVSDEGYSLWFADSTARLSATDQRGFFEPP
jgi:hypothetical protein